MTKSSELAGVVKAIAAYISFVVTPTALGPALNQKSEVIQTLMGRSEAFLEDLVCSAPYYSLLDHFNPDIEDRQAEVGMSAVMGRVIVVLEIVSRVNDSLFCGLDNEYCGHDPVNLHAVDVLVYRIRPLRFRWASSNHTAQLFQLYRWLERITERIK